MSRKPPQPTLTNTSFLDEVASAVMKEKQPEICAVILPSYRAVQAFKRVYAKIHVGPCRLPAVMTLGAFMEGSDDSSLQIADQLEVLATLFSVQLKEKGGREGFDRYLSWGPVALADFHSIDHYQLNAASVFKNLKDIKDIEDWSFGEDKILSEDQIRFAEQWARLLPLYNSLHDTLKEKGLITKARRSRDICEGADTSMYHTVFTAGLAAITSAEKRYILSWKEVGKLRMFWDADISYVEDKQHEAGYFIREFSDGQSWKLDVRNTIASSESNITTVVCSSVTSACQYVREQIKELTEDELHKTVVVLPDASTLPVLLQALPVKKDGYNVTMGMSIRETPISPFINLVDRMTARGGKSWRFDELMSLSSQSLVGEAYRETELKKDAAKALHELAGKHAVWVNERLLREKSNGVFANFVEELRPLMSTNAEEYLKGYVVWSNRIGELLADSSDPWIKSGWACIRRVVGMTLRLQEKEGPCKTADDVRMLMKRLMSAEKIDLVGEPASGLQIMGLTETRALDFDRVIVLDCNEGLLPKHEIVDSFIPVDLQSALGLPGRHEHEASYAYSFYRLLNRSKDIYFLYRSNSGGKDGSEKSRYLQQLKHTYKPAGTALNLTEISYSMPLPGPRPEIPALQMTTAMKKSLTKWSEKGMSPSAINNMVGCERNFAYRYLFKLAETKDLEESMAASTLGSIVHFVFEEGLKGAKNMVLDEKHLLDIYSRLDERLEIATNMYYNQGLSEQGENLLLIRSARSTIIKLLNKEIAELKEKPNETIIIKELEDELEAAYTLRNGSDIKFYGKADRVETVNGITRVVDYKTGKATQAELKLAGEWEEKLDKGKTGKALQLMVYCAMLLKRAEQEHSVKASIRSGRNSKEGLLDLNIDGSTEISKVHIDRLLDWICGRLESLQEEDRDMEHNDDSHFCDYCVVLDPPYKFYA